MSADRLAGRAARKKTTPLDLVYLARRRDLCAQVEGCN